MASRLKEDERNERTIRNLLKLPENRRCINCNSLGPQYVCTSFWTFVCTTCSGIHREFTHRVKSVSMAKFTTQEVSALQGGGNASAKEIYLKEWDTQRQSLPDSSNVERLRDFIKHVYVDRRYSGERSFDKPPRSKTGETEDTYGSRSPPYETDRRYTDRPSPGGRSDTSSRNSYDERRSPEYNNQDFKKTSPARTDIVNDWRREDRFAKNPDSVRSPDHQQQQQQNISISSPPPVVRPVREILGESVSPLRVIEPPPPRSRSSHSLQQLPPQRTASSSSLASSNGNPNPATELRRESSLIDFDTDPEPSVPVVAQSGGSSFSDNWANFDSNPMEPSMVRCSKRRNTGPGAGTGTPPVFDTEALEALIAERVAAAIALYESQRADGSDPGDSTGGSGGNPRPCSYKHFMKCKPQSFFGNGGAIELTRWFEKTESAFQISSCALGDQVKYAACTFANTALTWWNGHVQTIGITAANSMSWDELKAMMLEEYCPRSEMQNLEQEFWNFTMKDSEVQAYTTRFTELAVLCPGMVTPIDKKIERYIWGLAPQIQSLVTAARPVTFEIAKSIAVRLTDQGIRHGTMVQRADPPFGESNKRKSWDISHHEECGSELGSEEYDESDSGSE